MVEIIGTDEFEAWYLALGTTESDLVDYVVGLLEARGVQLGHPHSTAIVKTSVALRELRVTSTAHPLRVFYAFDRVRAAVLLIGGTKKGDDRFYEEMVPLAEKIWKQYQREQEKK